MKKARMGDIFRGVTGMNKIPETPQEIWEAVKNRVGVKEELNGKRYGGNLVSSGDVFPIKRYPDIEKTIDKAMLKL